jgi:hypothetical protein
MTMITITITMTTPMATMSRKTSTAAPCIAMAA